MRPIPDRMQMDFLDNLLKPVGQLHIFKGTNKANLCSYQVKLDVRPKGVEIPVMWGKTDDSCIFRRIMKDI